MYVLGLVCTAFWIFMAVSKSAQRHSLLTRACNLFFNSICVCPHAFAKMKSWYVLDNKPDVIRILGELMSEKNRWQRNSSETIEVCRSEGTLIGKEAAFAYCTANILLVKKATFPCLFFPCFFNVKNIIKQL